MSSFGKRLAECRRAKKMTQKQLGEFLGITERGVRRYEGGDREPKIDALVKLADFFGVSIDYLVGRTDKKDLNL